MTKSAASGLRKTSAGTGLGISSSAASTTRSTVTCKMQCGWADRQELVQSPSPVRRLQHSMTGAARRKAGRAVGMTAGSPSAGWRETTTVGQSIAAARWAVPLSLPRKQVAALEHRANRAQRQPAKDVGWHGQLHGQCRRFAVLLAGADDYRLHRAQSVQSRNRLGIAFQRPFASSRRRSRCRARPAIVRRRGASTARRRTCGRSRSGRSPTGD